MVILRKERGGTCTEKARDLLRESRDNSLRRDARSLKWEVNKKKWLSSRMPREA